MARGGNMENGDFKHIPIGGIRTDPTAEELVRSEAMKPYLELLKARIEGRDAEEEVAVLSALPLEERYVWRIVSALKWAFATWRTENLIADLQTLSAADLRKIVEPLEIRAIQFCMFLDTLLGEDALKRWCCAPSGA